MSLSLRMRSGRFSNFGPLQSKHSCCHKELLFHWQPDEVRRFLDARILHHNAQSAVKLAPEQLLKLRGCPCPSSSVHGLNLELPRA